MRASESLSTGTPIDEVSLKSQTRGGLAEYTRPWKLVTFFLGLALLIFGSFYYSFPHWDVPISLIMATLAYVAAPWSLRVIVERRWKLWPAMLLATWITVDGSFWMYWRFKNPAILDLMREANIPVSLAAYGICGVIWFYRGSLRELSSEMGALLRQSRSDRPK